MNKFEELEAFVAVVDRHSFSRAADKLGVAKSFLSRRVSDL
jgi:DNA-binding transcriptional LysR family regulator